MTGEGAVVAAAMVQCVVGVLIMRQHRQEVRWGLNWLAAAMLTGALDNLLVFALSASSTVNAAVPAFGLGLVALIGFSSLAALLVGTLQYSAYRFRGGPGWVLGGGLVMALLSLGLVRAGMPMGGDFIAVLVFVVAASLAWRAHRRERTVGFDFLAASLFAYPLVVGLASFTVDSHDGLRAIAALTYAVIGVSLLAVVLGRRTQALNQSLQQRQILESQWQLANRMVEASVDALMLLQGGRIRSANGACASLFGCAASALSGRAFLELSAVVQADGVAAAARLTQLQAEVMADRPACFSWLCRRADGLTFPAEGVLSRLQDGVGDAYVISLRDVSARQQAETQLRDSEDRLRLISSNLPDSWVFQRECDALGGSRYTFASAGVEQLFGLTSAELMSDASLLNARIHPGDHDMLRQREAEALAGMTELRVEYRCRGASGENRWFLRSASPRRLAEGVVVWDGIEIDVTAEKLASLAFERQVRAFAVLNEIAGGSELTLAEQLSKALCLGAEFLDLEAAVICQSEDGNCTVIALESGVDVGVSIGSRMPQAVSYCDLPLRQGRLVAVVDMGHSPYRDHPGYRKLGLETYIGACLEVRGRVYGCLSFAGRGVREKPFSDGEHYFVHLLARWVAAAIERDQAVRQVRRLAHLVRHANDAMFLLRDGVFLACNDAAVAIFQMPREALVGRSPETLSPPCQPSGVASSELARRYLGAVLGGEPQRFEWQHLKGDATTFDADVSLSSFSEDGETLVIAVVRDISIRKQREREIGELNDTLEQRVLQRTEELASALEDLRHTQDELLQREKLASLGALVAGVAHELNTPIGNAVTVSTTLVDAHRAFAGVLAGGLTRRALEAFLADVGEGAQIIERNLARAAELLGSFKQLAVDQTSYQRRTFDLGEVVREVTLAMRPSVRRTPFQLREDLPAELRLDSYPGPLGQVLMNLINNALMHAFDGRERGLIRVAAQLEMPGFVSLTVSDDGGGIPLVSQKRIFDPFYTTRLGSGGSGLGLHITYHLVTGILGGRIEVDSVPGEGACFRLILPQQAPVPSESALA